MLFLFDQVEPSFAVIYQTVSLFTGFLCFFFPSFTGFYRVLPSFTGSYRVLLGFTGFYWVLPGFTAFYRVLLDFTGF